MGALERLHQLLPRPHQLAVLAQHPGLHAVEAHVLAVGAGLAAEALGVGAVFDGQLVFAQDDVAIDIGHGHLGRRDEVEVVLVAVVHLAFLVGKLACTIAGSGIDHRGGHHLKVAGGTGFVEEEIDERALQTGTPADIYGEAGAGDFHAEVQVEEVVLLGQLGQQA